MVANSLSKNPTIRALKSQLMEDTMIQHLYNYALSGQHLTVYHLT